MKKTYKETIDQIKDILAKIESGEPDVDELTSLVNQALTLIHKCQSKLRETEKRIQEDFDKDNLPTE